MDLQEYIEQLREIVSSPALDQSPISRYDTAKIRQTVNNVQTTCQHIFTEIKALNRSLPQ